jgi:hypothetical protein
MLADSVTVASAKKIVASEIGRFPEQLEFKYDEIELPDAVQLAFLNIRRVILVTIKPAPKVAIVLPGGEKKAVDGDKTVGDIAAEIGQELGKNVYLAVGKKRLTDAKRIAEIREGIIEVVISSTTPIPQHQNSLSRLIASQPPPRGVPFSFVLPDGKRVRQNFERTATFEKVAAHFSAQLNAKIEILFDGSVIDLDMTFEELEATTEQDFVLLVSGN